MSRPAWGGVVILLAVLLLPGEGNGRLLNLGGSLDVTYGKLRSKEGSRIFETHSLQQRYNLRNFGDLGDPRLGSYTAGVTFLKQDVSTNSHAPDRDFQLFDYSFSGNFLPYSVSPFSLYAQRVINENKDGFVTKNRITTYGANWTLKMDRFPRLVVSLNRSELKSDDRLRLPDTVNSTVNVDTTGRLDRTDWTARYQFNQTDTARSGGVAESFDSHAVNLTTRSQLTSWMVLSTFARYATHGGSSATGLSFFPERSAGASLFLSPSNKVDTNLRYEYSDIPNAVSFRRQLALANINIHPTLQTDILASLRYFTFETGTTHTDAPFADLNFTWRPFFGLTTGVGVNAGQTRTSGESTLTESRFHRYRFFTNYAKTLELIRYNASYSLSYGVNRMTRSGLGPAPIETDQDLMNTLSVGVENTRIRIVHVASSVTVNHIQRSVHTVQSERDQSSVVVHLGADSNYFRSLLQPGDSLQLSGSSQLTHIEGFGVDGDSWTLEGRGSYFIRGLIATVGYAHQDYPSGFYTDTDMIYEELQWMASVAAFTATIHLRNSNQWGEGDPTLDRSIREGTINLSWQIGLFFASLDYRISNDDTAGVRFLNQSLYARVSRTF